MGTNARQQQGVFFFRQHREGESYHLLANQQKESLVTM